MHLHSGPFVSVVDVTLRDGLQDQPQFVATADKVRIAQLLMGAGYRELEVTSMMRPDWIAQTADAEEVLAHLAPAPGVRRHVLVPNRRGLDRALKTNAEVVTFVISASTLHNQHNLNCTTAESVGRVRPLVEEAKRAGRDVRGTVSTAFGCTLQGDISAQEVLAVVDPYVEAGVDQICLADTVGLARLGRFEAILDVVLARVSSDRVALHLHERPGEAITEMVEAGLSGGIRVFDSAIGGLGGCPFAPGAPGNLKAEWLLPYLHDHGYQTGIDSVALTEIALALGVALGKGKPIQGHGQSNVSDGAPA
ncbi:MAG: hydroxymethylglutaryl-CoA lyase [Sulfobacillus acidophilus]|uniref:Hydroxymethylglutaryl-CoA lyase n=1 Tax=Sulfobacillus acidophilus TaxID=53633 RepID=A0A2T2WHE5_9FIRM|nr:MAG: hydroxymethylglutaryl-CoA lyase [Sulfobacillus acidophilus]